LSPQWAWTQSLDLSRHLSSSKGKLSTHRRRDIDHLNALLFQTDLSQQLADVFNSPASVYITILVMTIARQSTGHHHTVGAVLKGVQYVEHIHTA